jgi:hypothetical protein
MSKPSIFNTDLISDIANQKVVIFVGAGASKWAKPTSGNSFKDWNSFLEHAAKSAAPKIRKLVKERLDAKDYLIASELLKTALAEKWATILEAEFQQAADISRLHKAIISLNQRIIVTTNFDKLIENAWTGSNVTRYPKVISKIDQQAFKLFRDDDAYLIKIHGSIDESENIVFDKTSFQRAAFSNRFYQDLIGTLLLTHTFLFIGFSMDDPAVSLLVESHAYRYSDTRPHYAFISGKSQPEIDDLSKRIRKLFVLRYPKENNHSDLAGKIEQLAMLGTKRRKEFAAEKMEV